jgi:starch phosphorylase
MLPIHTYNVTPKLPEALEPLREMVFNLWWTWQPDARRLFRDLDHTLWDRTNHNPLRMLQLSRQQRLDEVSRNEDFLREMRAVHARFRAYMGESKTYGKGRSGTPIAGGAPIAYFSAEFGFHESVPNYSGGLGILSGDHCKSASDLDLPFVAFTLLYRHGYFRQQIDKEGVQNSIQLNQNFSHLPLKDALDAKGKALFIHVDLLGHPVRVKVWCLQVGRISLFMLDTDLPDNTPEDRIITAQLYGGDTELRIQQEIVLGIGGVHALRAMGVKPAVYHMNEGHSAFLSLELIRREVEENKVNFMSALQVVAAGNIFTTHTPVPAGNDAFDLEMMRKYFGDYPAKVGIEFETFVSFGQERKDPHQKFSMTILALRTSRHANGVSALHGKVSQGLWKDVWAGVPQTEVPITSITNGVHTRTWAAPEFTALYDKYMPGWEEHLSDAELNADFWNKVYNIPDEDLWSTHVKLKNRLMHFARQRVRAQRERLKESPAKLRATAELLNPDALTVGFARRFATYKRATLLFSDPERLQKLINNTERPVQFIFAGKAHPKDEPGKGFIQQVYKYSRMPEFEKSIVFLEDYDTYVGRRLYQGVDLWLNNPRRPLEASGTSGMKLPPNGGLNLSVLDGWWVEAYEKNTKSGWVIGGELPTTPETIDEKFEDEVDVASLFHVLETQIVPLFYAKPDGRLPLAWLQLMRESIRTVVPEFNTHRMVREYNEKLYEPAARKHAELAQGGAKKAVELSRWKEQMRKEWPQITIEKVEVPMTAQGAIEAGASLSVSAVVHLGTIAPGEVKVEVYYGPTENEEIADPSIAELPLKKPMAEKGKYQFEGSIQAAESGSYGLSVRVVPRHENLTQAHELRLIKWA